MNMDFEEDVVKCLQTLQGGGIILYPTDTVWGLGCDATNEAAVKRMFELKRRPAANSMIVLVAGERDVLQYVAAVDLSLFDHLATVTKPTTVVYDGAIGLAPSLVAADGSIGIRICQEPFCRSLIRRFRKPIVSTSANFSGAPTPRIFREIDRELSEAVDRVVRYRQDDLQPAESSAVIRWKQGSIEVLRP